MLTRDNGSNKYAIVATTAALAISYLPSSGGEEPLMPLERHNLQISKPQPWEDDYGISESSVSATTQDTRMQVISDFANKVLLESADLDPDIIKALKNDFWNLI